MNVEQTLTDELRIVAAAVDAPPPPSVATLVGAADRTRVRTSAKRLAATGLVAAAAVGAIVIGNQLGRPTTTPPGPTNPSETPTSLPTGSAPRVPYIVGETLYVDGTAQQGRWIGVQTAGGNTLALQAGGSPGSTAVTGVLFRSGALIERLPAARGPMMSRDGSKLTWIEVTGGNADLVVRNLADDRELGRLPLDPETVTGDSEATVNLTAIDDDGTVHWGSVLLNRSWKPGSDPVDVGGNAATPQVQGFPRSAVDVQLSPDGSMGAWLTDRTGRSETSTWDGVTVQVPDQPGTRFTLALPEKSDLRGVVWETTDDLLLTVFENADGTDVQLVRCSVVDRECEIAPTP
jgi:hypothetical protein